MSMVKNMWKKLKTKGNFKLPVDIYWLMLVRELHWPNKSKPLGIHNNQKNQQNRIKTTKMAKVSNKDT